MKELRDRNAIEADRRRRYKKQRENSDVMNFGI